MAKMNNITTSILRKVRVGDALTNKELETAIAFYTTLSESLDAITVVEGGYSFASNHARRDLERLKLFDHNRKDRRLNG